MPINRAPFTLTAQYFNKVPSLPPPIFAFNYVFSTPWHNIFPFAFDLFDPIFDAYKYYNSISIPNKQVNTSFTYQFDAFLSFNHATNSSFFIVFSTFYIDKHAEKGYYIHSENSS